MTFTASQAGPLPLCPLLCSPGHWRRIEDESVGALCMTDPMDKDAVQDLEELDGKKLKSVTKEEGLGLGR